MNIQKLYSLTRQAINDYNLISDGDKIAVGVSGGKDSLTLLMILSGLQKFLPQKFELMAITCDVGFEGMDFSNVKSLCDKLNIPYEIVHTQIYDIVFNSNRQSQHPNHSDERPCALCAKLRKGAMYDRLVQLGFNKIAYAHNKDDVIETAFMSMIFEGRFYSFPPLTKLDRTEITVIRPMIYVPEKSVEEFAQKENLPIVKNKCPVDGATKRAYAKNLVAQINRENPGAKDRIMHAITSQDFDDWPKRTGQSNRL